MASSLHVLICLISSYCNTFPWRAFSGIKKNIIKMKQNKVKNFIWEEPNQLTILRACLAILTRDNQEKK